MCLGGEAELLLNFPHTGLALSTAFLRGMLTARLLILLFVCFPGLSVVGVLCFGSFPSVGLALNKYFPVTRVLIGVPAAVVDTGWKVFSEVLFDTDYI